jgi:hypothetical protein
MTRVSVLLVPTLAAGLSDAHAQDYPARQVMSGTKTPQT